MKGKFRTLFFVLCFFSLNKIHSQIDLNCFFEDKDKFYQNQWVGFSLYDPSEDKEIYNYQGDHYFVPASNTKIFTLYTGLKMLPDSIPALKYLIKNDTLYFQGTGDPSLLHSFFKQKKVIDFLKSRKETLMLKSNNYTDTTFGPGWAWEDFSEDFSPERNNFPLYGNVVTVNINKSINCIPSYFSDSVKTEKQLFLRKKNQNIFYTNSSKTIEIPFITSDVLTQQLLEKETEKPICFTDIFPSGETQTLYSIPSDDLYKRMMEVSDNFLAEQVLILSSSTISENLSTQKTLDYMMKNYFYQLPQPPKWVDGSGLSRYNLISPQDFVWILNSLYKSIPENRLLSFFPVGGVSGTLKSSFKAEQPYIFAKTGSMGGVYNLSGFIKCKSGKKLIFSFMNNNFTHSFKEIKAKMQELLERIRDCY